MQIDVVKGLKAIEEVKVDLLNAQCLLHQGTLNGSDAEIIQSLADNVILSYLLCRRLGADFSRLDRTLMHRLQEFKVSDKLKLESQWGDISLLISYLAPDE